MHSAPIKVRVAHNGGSLLDSGVDSRVHTATVREMPVAECCCSPSSSTTSVAPRCPATGTRGLAVEARTLRALLTSAALTTLTNGPHYFCPDPACDIVYFGVDGSSFRQEDVRATVWQKSSGQNRTICHCFGENEADIRREIARTGRCGAVARVRAHIAAGRCACDLRNPRGACCLGELTETVRRIGVEHTASSAPPTTR